MSKNTNAAPVRDWLLKKYQKALRTIWEQTAEIAALKARLLSAEYETSLAGDLLKTRDDNYTQQVKRFMETLTVVLQADDERIPLDILFKSQSPTGMELSVGFSQDELVDQDEDISATGPSGPLDAVSRVLDSDAFKAYQCGKADLPKAPFLNREVAQRYTQAELQDTYLTRSHEPQLVDSRGNPLESDFGVVG